MTTLIKNNKLNGYLDKDDSGQEVYKSYADDIFYSSFTDIYLNDSEEEYFWKNFGLGEGVRLTLKIATKRKDFRPVGYEKEFGEPIQILHDLTEMINQRYGLSFIMAGIAKMCLFYLPGKYKVESELRAIYRLFNSSWGAPADWGLSPDPGVQINGSGHRFIEFPLGSPSGFDYQLEILEIQTNEVLHNAAGISIIQRP